jgi:hypothetical protein
MSSEYMYIGFQSCKDIFETPCGLQRLVYRSLHVSVCSQETFLTLMNNLVTVSATVATATYTPNCVYRKEMEKC